MCITVCMTHTVPLMVAVVMSTYCCTFRAFLLKARRNSNFTLLEWQFVEQLKCIFDVSTPLVLVHVKETLEDFVAHFWCLWSFCRQSQFHDYITNII